jgi:hypothetical protein
MSGEISSVFFLLATVLEPFPCDLKLNPSMLVNSYEGQRHVSRYRESTTSLTLNVSSESTSASAKVISTS